MAGGGSSPMSGRRIPRPSSVCSLSGRGSCWRTQGRASSTSAWSPRRGARRHPDRSNPPVDVLDVQIVPGQIQGQRAALQVQGLVRPSGDVLRQLDRAAIAREHHGIGHVRPLLDGDARPIVGIGSSRRRREERSRKKSGNPEGGQAVTDDGVAPSEGSGHHRRGCFQACLMHGHLRLSFGLGATTDRAQTLPSHCSGQGRS